MKILIALGGNALLQRGQPFAAMYESYGPEIVKEVVAYQLKHGGLSRFENFRYYHEKLLGIELTKDMELELGAKFSDLVEDAVVKAPSVSGAKEFINKFYLELDFFVASGTPDDELKRIAHRRGISQYFKSLHGSPPRKEFIIENILKSQNVDRSSVLMVGDAMTDYDAAQRTGLNFVWRISHNDSRIPEGVKTISDLTELERLIL